MDTRAIVVILEGLRCRKIKVNVQKGWVSSECPLSRWEHGGGRDEHPSFGVSISREKRSSYKCFACGASGSLVELFFRLMSHGWDVSPLQTLVVQEVRRDDLDALVKKVRESAYMASPPGGSKSGPRSSFRLEPPSGETAVLAEDTLKLFGKLPLDVLTYLQIDRRLDTRTIEKFELAWHEGRRRIAIPVRNMLGELVNVSGRYFDEGVKPPYLHGKGFRKETVLYGEHLMPRDGSKLPLGCVVEGFFDVMYLTQKGYPAVAIMGTDCSSQQVTKLKRFFDRVKVIGDGDDAGRKMGKRLVAALGAIGELVELPEGMDPDELSDEQLVKFLS